MRPVRVVTGVFAMAVIVGSFGLMALIAVTVAIGWLYKQL